MTKRWLINTVLLIIALILAWLLWAHPQTPVVAIPPTLTALKPANVTTVTVQQPGRPLITLTRKGSQWFLQTPFHARADQFRLAALTDLVSTSVTDQFAPPPTGLTPFGLAPARLTLTLNQTRILIGDRHLFANQNLRYAYANGRIALISAEAIHPRRLQVDSFLSTELLGNHIHPIAFTFRHFQVIRRQGIWRVLPAAPVSNDRINTFVDEWRYARALAVTRYHGAIARGRILIEYKQPMAGGKRQLKTLTIDILATTPELILYRPSEGLEYHFPAEIGKRLLHITS